MRRGDRRALPRGLPRRRRRPRRGPSSAARRSPRCVAAPSGRRRSARPRPPSARTGPRSTSPAGEEERIDLLEAAGEMALLDGRYEDSLEPVRGRRRQAQRARARPGRGSSGLQDRAGASACRSRRRRHRPYAPRPRPTERRRPGSRHRPDQRRARRGPALLRTSGRGPGAPRAGPRARTGARAPERARERADLQGAAVRRGRPGRRGAHPVRRRGRALPVARAHRPAVRRRAQRRRFPAEIRPAGRRRAHQRRADHGEAHRQPLLRERRGVEPDAHVGLRRLLGRASSGSDSSCSKRRASDLGPRTFTSSWRW